MDQMPNPIGIWNQCTRDQATARVPLLATDVAGAFTFVLTSMVSPITDVVGAFTFVITNELAWPFPSVDQHSSSRHLRVVVFGPALQTAQLNYLHQSLPYTPTGTVMDVQCSHS